MHREFPHMHRFRILLAIVFVAATALAAHAQTTLNAALSGTPWNNTATLTTGTGLALNLGLRFDYLIVGGGGGGGGFFGGGGGAGGLLTNVGGTGLPRTPGNYGVTVGTGGAGGLGSANTRGANGGNSAIFGLSATGGGGGGAYFGNQPTRQNVGSSGGSGGGSAADDNQLTAVAGGAGTGGQGNNGGSGYYATGTNRWRGGGGGGAGSAGTSASSTAVGLGGSGTTSAITGVSVTYAGGGGGGSESVAAAGGSGIGGNGGFGSTASTGQGQNGAANTGSGGGGVGFLSSGTGGTGGSGVVIVRYPSTTDVTSGGSTSGTYSDGGNTWHYEQFTTSGTLALSFATANLVATQSGAISGTGGLTYNSQGTLSLAAANTFTGNTRVQAGTLNLANVDSLQSSTLDMNGSDSGTVAFGVAGTNTYTLGGLQGSRNIALGANSLSIGGNGASTTYSGTLSGGGGLTKLGSGTTTLSGTNSYSGGTVVSAGRIVGTTDSLQGAITNNAAVEFSQAASGTYSGVIGGTGSVTKTGAGTVTLSGTSSYSGGSTVSAGRLIGTSDSLQGAITNNAAVEFSQAASGSYAGNMSGSGSLTKSGAGGLTLSGSNSFSGGAALNAGTLTVGSASALGSTGTISFGGGTLQYSAANTTDYSSRFSTAASQAYSLDTNGQNVTVATALTSSGGSLTKSGLGTLTLTGSNTYSGTTAISSGTLQVGNGGATGELGGTGSVTNNGVLAVNRSNAFSFARAITGTGAFQHLGTGTTALSGSNTYSGGTTVSAGRLIGTTDSLQGGITNNAAVEFSQTTNGIYSGNMGGTGSLTKTGAGTVTLSGTNNHSGGTTVSAGRLIGTSDSLQGAITNSAAVEFAQTASGTYAGNMSGSGSLTKTGAGSVTLSGSNSFFGGTTISAGTLAAVAIADSGVSSIGTSGTLTLAGGTLDYTGSGASTTARIVDIATGNTTSTIGVADAAGRLTLTGKIWNSDVAHPNVVLNKTGAGTLEIAGAGSNVGTSLVVQSGTVVLNATQRAVYEVRGLDAGATLRLERSDQIFSGDAITTTGNIRMTGGTLDLNGFNEIVNRVSGADFSTAGTGVITSNAPAQFTFGNNLAGRPSRFAGTITGSVAITVKGTNPVTLSGDNTYSGSTTIQDAGSQLRIGVGGTTGSLGTGAVTNGGELVFDRSDSVTVSNAISGSGALVQAGAGTTTLVGVNTYAGTTTIAAGRLVGSTASLPGAIANASQLEFAQALTGTFASVISGTGSFAKTGVGNLILSGSSNYTGATSVAGGRLSVNGSLGTSSVAVLAAAELGGSGSIAGPVSIANGATLSPGNSIQSLATGTATFAAGATFEYEIDSTDLNALATAADLLVVNGDLNLDTGNGTLLTFLDLASAPQPFVEDTTIFAMINYSGSWNGGLFTLDGNVLSDGERFMVGDQQWEIDYNRTSAAGLANFTGDYVGSNFVAITAVPEPSTLVLMAIGAGVMTFVARRRTRSMPV